MTTITISGDSVAADTNGFGSALTAATPGTTLFALTATEAGDGLAHKVIITPSASVTGNYVITSTNPNGEPQTETLATDTTNAVTSAKYHLSLTSVKSPSGLSTNNVDIGWTAASVTPWLYLAAHGEFKAPGMGFVATVDSGSPTFTVQHTLDGGQTATNHATVASKSASTEGTYTTPVQAIRNSWAAAGEVTIHGYF